MGVLQGEGGDFEAQGFENVCCGVVQVLVRLQVVDYVSQER